MTSVAGEFIATTILLCGTLMYEEDEEYAKKQPAALEPQEKVLIITRRLYNGDLRRHFVGIVERYDERAIRVRGYAFVYELKRGGFVKRKSQRVRLFPLDNHIIIFVLPEESDLSEVTYEVSEDNGLVVTDHRHFKLELDEFNG